MRTRVLWLVVTYYKLVVSHVSDILRDAVASNQLADVG